jgi:hypothetical protein
VRTVFGELTVRSPRLHRCTCRPHHTKRAGDSRGSVRKGNSRERGPMINESSLPPPLKSVVACRPPESPALHSQLIWSQSADVVGSSRLCSQFATAIQLPSLCP